jgi:hypothetical protein
MIPGPQEYLSFLMGADAIADDELTNLGIKILQGARSAFRGILIPARSSNSLEHSYTLKTGVVPRRSNVPPSSGK